MLHIFRTKEQSALSSVRIELKDVISLCARLVSVIGVAYRRDSGEDK